MKIKSVISAFLAFVMLVSLANVAFAAEGSNLTEISVMSSECVITSDFGNGQLLTVTDDFSVDDSKLTVNVYNADSAKLLKQKTFTFKELTVNSFDKCEVLDNGTYALYDSYKGKRVLLTSSLKIKKITSYTEKQIDYASLGKSNKLITSNFVKYEDYAYCDYSNDFAEQTNAIAFYDDNSSICLTKDYDISYRVDYCNKKLLASVNDDKKTVATAAVYDYSKGTYVNAESREFKKYNYVDIFCGTLDDTYAMFVVESANKSKSLYTTYIWKYSAESKKNNFSVKKVTAKDIKKLNSTLIKTLKNKYAINILLDKVPFTYPTYFDDNGKEYGGVISGASVFVTYLILKDLTGYLSYFPENFTQEMAEFGGKTHSFDIYIDKEIIGDSAAYANRIDGFLICFATDEYTSSHIPHEFLHLIDARIDDYLTMRGRYYEDLWCKLNPPNFFYYEEQDYDYRYFASAYAMTDSREDRAETFEYLFEAYNYSTQPYSQNAVKKKSIYLTSLIRKAYPSVAKLGFASWERWITQYPEKIKTKSTENSVKLSWKKSRKAEGYVLQKKSGKKWKIIYKGKKNAYKLKSLKSGKALALRVKAYRKDGNRTVSSSWEYIYTASKPKKLKSFNLSTNSSHQIIVKWSKIKACSGYQVQYARDKKFKDVIATRNVGKSNSSYTGRNFTKGRKYYVRVRTYKMSGGNYVYSGWTSAKSINSK